MGPIDWSHLSISDSIRHTVEDHPEEKQKKTRRKPEMCLTSSKIDPPQDVLRSETKVSAITQVLGGSRLDAEASPA